MRVVGARRRCVCRRSGLVSVRASVFGDRGRARCWHKTSTSSQCMQGASSIGLPSPSLVLVAPFAGQSVAGRGSVCAGFAAAWWRLLRGIIGNHHLSDNATLKRRADEGGGCLQGVGVITWAKHELVQAESRTPKVCLLTSSCFISARSDSTVNAPSVGALRSRRFSMPWGSIWCRTRIRNGIRLNAELKTGRGHEQRPLGR